MNRLDLDRRRSVVSQRAWRAPSDDRIRERFDVESAPAERALCRLPARVARAQRRQNGERFDVESAPGVSAVLSSPSARGARSATTERGAIRRRIGAPGVGGSVVSQRAWRALRDDSIGT